MADRDSAVQFHRDPLLFLDRAFPTAEDAIWLPGRQLCVAEPVAARAVLANEEGLYQEHSDFFHSRRGMFGPRSVQVQIGRASRALLRAHCAARADDLAESVRRELVPTSEWPDAGNRLLYQHLGAVLAASDSPIRLRRTLDEVVDRAVLAGARQRYSRLTRAVFRFRVMRELTLAVEHRRARGTGQPADLLDVVVSAAGPDVRAAELADVFLSFVFAIAGSVGFVLGWSVYLLATNPPTDAEPAWVVREALRLWPVAWMLARRPARRHEVAGVMVTPQDQVVVCPYLVHRHPRYWDEPASFRPERWAAIHDHKAFIPFGWGPHRCIAASLSMQLVEDVLRTIDDGYRLTLTCRNTRPCVGPALAPPRFALGLAPHRLSNHQKGGDQHVENRTCCDGGAGRSA
jgi:cytochrome P450